MEVLYYLVVNTCPPTARQPLNITAVYGHDIMLYCPVAGFPKSSTSWLHHGSHIKPPEIQEFHFPSNLQEGNRAHVSCTVISGDLPIKINWLKDGNPLPNEPAVQVQHHQFVSALLFSNLAAHHSGFYTCVAKNGAAQANFTSKLVVRVAPKWITEPIDTIVLYHHSASIHCQASGYPPPKVAWKFSKGSNPSLSNKLAKTDFVQQIENGSVIIKSAELDHTGYYT
ncbi:unnamed protein product [Nezara viridula]|uniref:Ig-like domain-containing protein n=1 Tax=Nezara viridula TaxID=85310 RepID=A0A9P0ED55_NEZVI|nr:unnamed protein product [Nezara viridula]